MQIHFQIVQTVCLIWVMFLVHFGTSRIIPYSDCGSAGGTIHSIDVTPCDLVPCHLDCNNDPTLKVNFTAKLSSSSAKTVLQYIVDGTPVPYPKTFDSCDEENIKCPIVAGTTYIYTMVLSCDPDLPKPHMQSIEWTLLGDKGNKIFCFDISFYHI